MNLNDFYGRRINSLEVLGREKSWKRICSGQVTVPGPPLRTLRTG